MNTPCSDCDFKLRCTGNAWQQCRMYREWLADMRENTKYNRWLRILVRRCRLVEKEM